MKFVYVFITLNLFQNNVAAFKPELTVGNDSASQVSSIQLPRPLIHGNSSIIKNRPLYPLHSPAIRIIGGKTASIKDFPSTACLVLTHLDQDDFRGGAAIISAYWAVTAAHCMLHISRKAIQNKKVSIRSNTEHWKKGYVEHIVVQSHSHERYDKELTDYDIALVKVYRPFTRHNEKPVPFAKKNFEYRDESLAMVLGWGTTDPNTTDPFVVERLRYVQISLTNVEKCRQSYAQVNESITERMICAVAPGKDACVYDSGGPLYQNNILIGLVSWAGTNCADDNLPGVYTKMSLFHEWMHNKIKG